MTDSSIRHVDEAQARQLIASEAIPILIDVGATWCMPCKMQQPFLGKFAAEFADRLVVAELDGDTASDFKAEWRVQAFPTLLFFKGGVLVKRKLGFKDYPDLRDAVWDFLGVSAEGQVVAACESEFAAAAAAAKEARDAEPPESPERQAMAKALEGVHQFADRLEAEVTAGTLSRAEFNSRVKAEQDKALAPYRHEVEAALAEGKAAASTYIAAIEAAATTFSLGTVRDC